MKYKPTAYRGHFLLVFTLVVVVLGIVKCVNPQLALPQLAPVAEAPVRPAAPQVLDSVQLHAQAVDSLLLRPHTLPVLLWPDGRPVKNRVVSVRRFEEAFPDLNDVQLATAQRLGIQPIENRDEARHRLKELVYVGDSPFYTIQPLHQSIPYLVPRAATLLQVIGRAFTDSLVTKGYEPHKLIVTSVLRTNEDVNRLRNVNRNASENSCHRFGTTFDISYNRFLEIHDDGTDEVRWVTVFKSILAEVLEDQRLMGTCYVKYEVHQSCFHITAR